VSVSVSVCPNISKGKTKAIWLIKIGSIMLYLKYNFDFIIVDMDVKPTYLPIGVMKISSLCYHLVFYRYKTKNTGNSNKGDSPIQS
jgi:hypothetical protein